MESDETSCSQWGILGSTETYSFRLQTPCGDHTETFVIQGSALSANSMSTCLKDNIGQINGTLLRFNPFLVATDLVSHSPSHAPEPLLNSGTRKVDIQNMNDMGGTLNIESTMQQ